MNTVYSAAQNFDTYKLYENSFFFKMIYTKTLSNDGWKLIHYYYTQHIHRWLRAWYLSTGT